LLKIKFYGRTDFAEAMGSGSGTTGVQKVLEWMATLVQHCRYAPSFMQACAMRAVRCGRCSRHGGC
jgi:hypothetical protein